MANSVYPVINITKPGNADEYIIKTTTTFKNQEVKFKLGEEFEEKRMDGVLCKVSTIAIIKQMAALIFILISFIYLSFFHSHSLSLFFNYSVLFLDISREKW